MAVIPVIPDNNLLRRLAIKILNFSAIDKNSVLPSTNVHYFVTATVSVRGNTGGGGGYSGLMVSELHRTVILGKTLTIIVPLDLHSVVQIQCLG